MKLFRQLLLSLFPQEVLHQQMNPASMFVSFISPKQFFSVINRKVVENYKLNLFDIGLDPFEVKIGFGEQPTLNVKDIDFYYAYNATANLNGWNFYTPGNIGTAIGLVMAIATKDIFKAYRHTYYISFLVSIYLLTFVFVSRIKVFPHTDKEKNYRWFIDLFFAFYDMSLDESGHEVDDRIVAKIKAALLQEIQLFFMLFYVYRRMNVLFSPPTISDKDFYQRLFDDNLKKGKHKTIINEFIQNAHLYAKIGACSDQDKILMKIVFPADILIRYILQGEDSYLVADKLLSGLYDKDTLKSYLHSFLHNDDQLESFIRYIMDWKLFKASYFTGIKKLTAHKFRLQHDFETSQEIDSFISSLDDASSLDGVKVPDALKKESMMMDRLVNFYITYIGGLRVARGDNFSLRLFKKPLIDALLVNQGPDTTKQDSLFFYGGLLYNYSKNIFYYTYAYENVKAGYDTFNLPLRPSFKEVYSNMFILKLFDENFIHTLLQDLNTKSIKIYINNESILTSFRSLFGATISTTIGLGDNAFITALYGDISFFLQNMPHMQSLLHEYITPKDIVTLKENIYTFDFQLWKAALTWLYDHDIVLADSYHDMSILGIFAQLRETLFGFLLWYVYIQHDQEIAKVELYTQALKKIYIVDVLNLAERYVPVFSDMIDALAISYKDILLGWGTIDDNSKYFSIGVGNWISFIENRTREQTHQEVMGEDVIRFRGYLKTITYYNKRYLIPK